MGFTGPWSTRLTFAAFDTTASAEGVLDLAGAYDLRVEARSGNLDRLNALLPEMDLPPIRAMKLATHLTNSRVPGDLPVIGETRLQFAGSDPFALVPGLKLGGFDLSLTTAGGRRRSTGSASMAAARSGWRERWVSRVTWMPATP